MKLVKNNSKEKPFSIQIICNGFSQKRDAFYKYRKRYAEQKQVESDAFTFFIPFSSIKLHLFHLRKQKK